MELKEKNEECTQKLGDISIKTGIEYGRARIPFNESDNKGGDAGGSIQMRNMRFQETKKNWNKTTPCACTQGTYTIVLRNMRQLFYGMS